MSSLIDLLLLALWQTFYMVVVSGAIASLLGIPLGFILHATGHHGLGRQVLLNKILGFSLNALRSIPFIILLVLVLPITRWIVGTSIGTTAAIVPLSIGAIPFIARIVETALGEVPRGLTEAALSFGTSPLQVMTKVLWPEALPNIIQGITLMLITLVGFSAMAGVVGGGGLGDIGIRYGYQRFDLPVMLLTVALLIVMVQLIQIVGSYFAQRVRH